MRRIASFLVVGTLASCSTNNKPGSPEPAAPAGGSSAALGGVTVGETVLIARHAFHPGAGGFAWGGGGHSALVRGDGTLAFTPILQDSPAARINHTVGVALELRTSELGRDSTVTASATPRLDGERVALEHGIALERWTAVGGGVEQSWELAHRPEGSGDFVVRVAAAGQTFVKATATGLHFADASGRVGVKYGVATFVDAAGKRTEIKPTWEDGRIVLTVPAQVIDTAAYPAVLDPTVSSEVTVDTAGAVNDSDPAVRFGGGVYLVTWLDSAAGAVRGAILDSSGAVTVAPFTITSGATYDGQDSGYDATGSRFIVCWTDLSANKIACNRVTTGGALGTQFDLIAATAPRNMHMATSGQSVIVYNIGNASNAEVRATTLPQGASAGTTPATVITNNGLINWDPAIGVLNSGGVTHYLISYTQEGGANSGVYAVHYAQFILDTPQRVNTTPVDSSHVAGGANTTFVVVYPNASSNASAVLGSLFTSTGFPAGSFTAYSGFNVLPAEAAYDGNRFAVATASATTPAMAYVSTTGTVGGSVNGPTSDARFNIPGVASDGNGHSLMAYVSSAGISALLYTSLPLSAACTTNNQCASGSCVGGVCCFSVCSAPNTVFSCGATGSCVVSGCTGGFSDCDGVASNGCETNTTNNTTGTNCGGCGAAFNCSTTNASGATCSGGICQPTCNSGFLHCAGNPLITGCETPDNTITNCGACGTTCPAAACTNPICSASGASFACGGVPQIQCGTPNCGLGSCAGTDTDGDGLQDAWENQGYVDVNCNNVNDGEGVDVQLPNADPNVPDVYVEIDYLQKAGSGASCTVDTNCTVPGEQCISGVCTHTHRPKDSSLTTVVNAVLRGENPTPGLPPIDPTRRGFRLHLDSTHMNSIDETATNGLVVSMGTSSGTRVLNAACVGSTAANYFDLKDANYFGALGSAYRDARKRVYHYVLFGHYANCPPGPAGTPEQFCSMCPADRSGASPLSGATGTSEKPGNDIIVSLGATYFDNGIPRSDINEGGTFLHELGHNLGLDHGVGPGYVPAAGPLKSPNYLSVMNYSYQLSGVTYTGTSGPTSKVDFADTQCTVDLNEAALDETAGAGCGASSPYLLRYFGTSGPTRFASGANGSPINWNVPTDATATDTNVSVDLNRNTVATEVHRSLNDWARVSGKFPNLTFEIGCLPWTLADGLAPASALSSNELTPAQAIQLGAATPPRSDVSVTVRPGCPTHWIALNSPTTVPVAIYSSPTFDASKLVPSSLVFAGETVSSTTVSDLNGDGLPDMLARFVMSGLTIPAGATSTLLSGNQANGTAMLVSATFTLVPSAGPVVTPKADANGYSGSMWPPDGQLQGWDLTACVQSAVDRCGVSLSPLTNGQITKITSDEKGANEMLITGNATFSLAKQRDGRGDGRVYTVYYTITDSIGDSTPGVCKFEVRHDSAGTPAVDSGVQQCTGSCP